MTFARRWSPRSSCFIGLVLAYGQPYLGQVGVSIAIDLVMVLLFVGYLAAARREA